MDSGNGRFVKIAAEDDEDLKKKVEALKKDYPNANIKALFQKGKTITIGDFEFRIIRITQKHMYLELRDPFPRGRKMNVDGSVFQVIEAVGRSYLKLKVLKRKTKG